MGKFTINSKQTGNLGKKVRGDTLRVKPIKVTVMSKKGRLFFSGKIGVTPSVAAPGETNTSDVTTDSPH